MFAQRARTTGAALQAVLTRAPRRANRFGTPSLRTFFQPPDGDSMSETSLLLQDIVEVSHEGVEFYEAAAKATSDKTLSGVFSKLAKAKQELVENLSTNMKPRKAGKHV